MNVSIPGGIMTIAYGRASAAVALAALIGAAACSGKSTTMDKSLEQDLAAVGGAPGIELASKSISPNLVISASEAGPTSKPAAAVRKVVPKPSPKPTVHVAERVAPAPAPAPQKTIEAP